MSEVALESAATTEQKPMSTVAFLLGLVPLLVYYAVLLWSARSTVSFEQMFREMELGTLPFSTEILVATFNVIREFWFIALPLNLGVGVAYMWLGMKNRTRMFWFAWVLAMLDLMLFFSIQYALMEPMFVILQKLGSSGS